MTATAFLKCPHCCLSIAVNLIILEYFQGSLPQSSCIWSCFLFTNFYSKWLLLQVIFLLLFTGYDGSYVMCPFFLSRFSCDETTAEVLLMICQLKPGCPSHSRCCFKMGSQPYETFFLPFHVVLLFHSRLLHLPTFPAPQIFVRQSWYIPARRVNLQAGAGKVRNSR